MLGVYDYTVILTYLSALSAGIGIILAQAGEGHPYIGCICLVFCGICDAFDGKVARTKKNRTDYEKKFGIQIDSLSDLIAFGVLPASIGNAMILVRGVKLSIPVHVLLWAIFLLYILAALIRLANFNVTEEERARVEGGVRKYYEGLPVTAASLIFPTVGLIDYKYSIDGMMVFFVVMFITGFLFVSKIKIPKPGTKEIMILLGIGVLELLFLFFR